MRHQECDKASFGTICPPRDLKSPWANPDTEQLASAATWSLALILALPPVIQGTWAIDKCILNSL